ncbi:MAG TPA: prealbumin-like fold domain-containing protein, partial [Acidimicrobiales bacterium]|nr:prealbumin-like fold domain-containing protein [Acidimicrobiales bacterium]
GTFTTNADGGVCVTNLPQDTTLTVTEITPPPGYTLPDPASQEVRVDDDGDCTSRDVLFVDKPEGNVGSGTPTPTPTPEGSVGAATPTPTPSLSPTHSPGQTPEGSVEAAIGSPAASVPNTAFQPQGTGSNPTGTFLAVLVLIVSLMALAVANVRVARQRQ